MPERGGWRRATTQRAWAALVKIGAPVQVASFGPKSGEGDGAGGRRRRRRRAGDGGHVGDRAADDRVGVACELMEGVAADTVVTSVPLLRRPGTVGPENVALTVGKVWAPGDPGSESIAGLLRMRASKCTTHASPVGRSRVPSPPGGTRRQRPGAASVAVQLPSQEEFPGGVDWPTKGPASSKTSGSTVPPMQSTPPPEQAG